MTGLTPAAQADRRAAPVSTLRGSPDTVWSAAASAAVLLTVLSASLTLGIGQASVAAGPLDAYISGNVVTENIRAQLTQNVGIAVAATWAVALLYVAVRRARGVRELATLTAIASPLAIAFALPSLLDYRIWFDKPLKHLVYLAAIVLLFERLVRHSMATIPERFGIDRAAALLPAAVRKALPFAIVCIAAAGYSAFASYYSVLEHWRFATGGYDLGIYDSLLANLLAGHPFRSPVCAPDLSYLSNHAEFGIFYIAPLYALFPRAETFLVAQGVVLGLSAIPLYLFAATQLPRATAAILALAYLLYAPMHGANFYDFHWMPMAMPVWFTLFYALARRKTWLIVVAVCVVLPIREETGVMLAVLGAFLVLSSYWPKLGLVFCGVGTTWFAVMKFVIMPLAGTWWFENMYAALIAPGERGYGSVVKTLLINPAYVWSTLTTELKLIYALHLFAPLAFLPLRKPPLTLLAIPGFFFTLLTTDYDPTLSIRFQYTTHWVPWIFGSSALCLMLIGSRPGGRPLRRAALAALMLGVFCHSYVYGAVLQRHVFIGGFERVAFGITPAERGAYKDFRALADLIPKNASVAASENIVAHVSNHVDAYTLKVTHGDSTYLLLSKSNLHGGDRVNAQKAFDLYSYGLVASSGDFYLFKRDYKSPQTAQAKTALGIH